MVRLYHYFSGSGFRDDNYSRFFRQYASNLGYTSDKCPVVKGSSISYGFVWWWGCVSPYSIAVMLILDASTWITGNKSQLYPAMIWQLQNPWTIFPISGLHVACNVSSWFRVQCLECLMGRNWSDLTFFLCRVSSPMSFWLLLLQRWLLRLYLLRIPSHCLNLFLGVFTKVACRPGLEGLHACSYAKMGTCFEGRNFVGLLWNSPLFRIRVHSIPT